VVESAITQVIAMSCVLRWFFATFYRCGGVQRQPKIVFTVKNRKMLSFFALSSVIL
jgi:hypothetical protein